MNRHALVLAADSAVTVTRWEQGRKEERYFKGTNKIFQLSAVNPVGLMIFDAADLQRVPWELIAKEFRQALGAKSYPSIGDYASKLFEYIDGHTKLFPSTYRTKLFIRNVDQIMIGTLVRANDDPRVTAAAADAVAADSARRTVLSERAAAIAGAPIKAPFTQANVEAAYNAHGAALHVEAVEDIHRFGAQTTFDPEALVKLGIDALYRDPEAYLATTGLVVAGFGDDEYFPSYEEFHCPGFIGERLFFEKKGGLSISVEDSGYFSAFATTSMVDTFTMGFARDVFGSIRRHLKTEMRVLGNKIATATGAVAPDLVQSLRLWIRR
jgi:hypothetical protein